MEPMVWPFSHHAQSRFLRHIPGQSDFGIPIAQLDGSTSMPEPYKPKYHKKPSGVTPTAKQLTPEQANKIIDDYLSGLEERLMTEIYNELKTDKMTTNNNTKKQQTHQEFMLERVNALITKTNRALAKMRGPLRASTFTTADAQLLDFGEEVKEFSEVQKGSKATVDGKPAEGEYLMPDGTKLTFERGVVTEIVTPVKNRLPFKAKRKPSGLRRPFHKN